MQFTLLSILPLVMMFSLLANAAAVNERAEAETLDAFQDQVLQIHNQYRAQYGARPLTWSATLAPGVNSWARSCKFQHSVPNGAYGENLAAGTGSYTLAQGIKAWMDEASKYDYSRPGFSAATGHFTQVVWKNSRQVACALASCGAGTIFSQPSKYLVCRYSPPGNYAGQFPQNVGRHV